MQSLFALQRFWHLSGWCNTKGADKPDRARTLLAIAILYDWRTERRIHPAYQIAIVAMAVVHIAVWWGFSSSTWLAFAKMIT